MRKYWLAAIIFFFSSTTTHAVSITVTGAPASAGEEEFSLNVTVEGAGNGTNYLRIDLYQDGTTNYFGETDNGSYWYNGSDGKQYAPVQIASSSANLAVKAKIGEPTLSAYPGPGNYKLRIRRYTSSGNQASNDSQTPVNISLTKTWPSPSPSPTPTPSPSPSPSSTIIPSPSPSPTLTPTPTPKASPSIKPSPSPSQSGNVEGATDSQVDLSGYGTTPSPLASTESKADPGKPTLNKNRAKTALIVGSSLILISFALFLGYRKYRLKRKDDTITP